jgi:hypothetical protein
MEYLLENAHLVTQFLLTIFGEIGDLDVIMVLALDGMVIFIIDLEWLNLFQEQFLHL